MFSSLIFTMWFGFGQTFAKNYGTYESGVSAKPTSVASCPAHIYNATSFAPIQFDTTTLAPDFNTTMAPDEYVFPHVDIYNVSYMWFSAIPTIWCLVVGSLVSLYKPQCPKKLNPELISPAFRKLFAFWPWIGPKITDYIDNTLQIGVDYVSESLVDFSCFSVQNSAHILVFVHLSAKLQSKQMRILF